MSSLDKERLGPTMLIMVSRLRSAHRPCWSVFLFLSPAGRCYLALAAVVGGCTCNKTEREERAREQESETRDDSCEHASYTIQRTHSQGQTTHRGVCQNTIWCMSNILNLTHMWHDAQEWMEHHRNYFDTAPKLCVTREDDGEVGYKI